MKIYDAVKTEQRAIEILKSHGSTWETTQSCNCECGVTPCIIGHDSEMNLIGFVAFCEGCGENDAFESDVVVEPVYPSR